MNIKIILTDYELSSSFYKNGKNWIKKIKTARKNNMSLKNYRNIYNCIKGIF